MPRLIYFPLPDERPTPPVALTVDEDSDGWWSGVQRCFVAVPIAGTLAAVTLSASLAFGYQQQTDDIVPQAPTIAVEDYWQVPTPPCPTARFLYLPDPEEIPAGSLFGVPQEDAWFPPWVVAPARPLVLWSGDDDLPIAPPTPLGVDEEYWWTAFSLPGALSVPVFSADDEIVPPPPPTEYALDSGTWMVQRVASAKRTVTVW